jgi:hypothetical protein
VYCNSKYEPSKFFASYSLSYRNSTMPFLLSTLDAGYLHIERVPSSTQVGYDTFKMSINASQGFYVILNTRYDPNWKLTTNISGVTSIDHFSLFGLVNAWYIPTKGSAEINLTYEPQNQLNGLYFISFLSTIVIVLLLLSRKIRHIKTLGIYYLKKILRYD